MAIQRTRIIDFHTHLYPPKIRAKAKELLSSSKYWMPHFLKYSEQAQLSDFTLNGPRGLLSSMENTGIERSVLLPVPTIAKAVQVANEYIFETVSAHPGKLTGFGCVHPDQPDTERQDTIDKIKNTYEFSGIKMHSIRGEFNPKSPAAMETYREIARQGLILLIDAYNHPPNAKAKGTDAHIFYDFPEQIVTTPEKLLFIKKSVPDIIMIGAHFGGTFKYDSAELLLRNGILLDMSFVVDYALGRFEQDEKVKVFPNSWTQEKLIRVIEDWRDQIIFGSDCPTITQEKSIKDVIELGLSPETLKIIMYKNAARLLNLEK